LTPKKHFSARVFSTFHMTKLSWLLAVAVALTLLAHNAAAQTPGFYQVSVPPYVLSFNVEDYGVFTETFNLAKGTSQKAGCVIGGVLAYYNATHLKAIVGSVNDQCGEVFSGSFAVVSSWVDSKGVVNLRFKNSTGTFVAAAARSASPIIPVGRFCTGASAPVAAAFKVLQSGGAYKMLVVAEGTDFKCGVSGTLFGTSIVKFTQSGDCSDLVIDSGSYSASSKTVTLKGSYMGQAATLSMTACSASAVATEMTLCGNVGTTLGGLTLSSEHDISAHYYNSTTTGSSAPCHFNGNYVIMPGGAVLTKGEMAGFCPDQLGLPLSRITKATYVTGALTLWVGTTQNIFTAAKCSRIPMGRYGAVNTVVNGAVSVAPDGAFVLYLGRASQGTFECQVSGRVLPGPAAGLEALVDDEKSTCTNLKMTIFSYSSSKKTITVGGKFETTSFSLAMPFLWVTK
jgi:hypothetical protein